MEEEEEKDVKESDVDESYSDELDDESLLPLFPLDGIKDEYLKTRFKKALWVSMMQNVTRYERGEKRSAPRFSDDRAALIAGCGDILPTSFFMIQQRIKPLMYFAIPRTASDIFTHGRLRDAITKHLQQLDDHQQCDAMIVAWPEPDIEDCCYLFQQIIRRTGIETQANIRAELPLVKTMKPSLVIFKNPFKGTLMEAIHIACQAFAYVAHYRARYQGQEGTIIMRDFINAEVRIIQDRMPRNGQRFSHESPDANEQNKPLRNFLDVQQTTSNVYQKKDTDKHTIIYAFEEVDPRIELNCLRVAKGLIWLCEQLTQFTQYAYYIIPIPMESHFLRTIMDLLHPIELRVRVPELGSKLDSSKVNVFYYIERNQPLDNRLASKTTFLVYEMQPISLGIGDLVLDIPANEPTLEGFSKPPKSRWKQIVKSYINGRRLKPLHLSPLVKFTGGACSQHCASADDVIFWKLERPWSFELHFTSAVEMCQMAHKLLHELAPQPADEKKAKRDDDQVGTIAVHGTCMRGIVAQASALFFDDLVILPTEKNGEFGYDEVDRMLQADELRSKRRFKHSSKLYTLKKKHIQLFYHRGQYVSSNTYVSFQKDANNVKHLYDVITRKNKTVSIIAAFVLPITDDVGFDKGYPDTDKLVFHLQQCFRRAFDGYPFQPLFLTHKTTETSKTLYHYCLLNIDMNKLKDKDNILTAQQFLTSKFIPNHITIFHAPQTHPFKKQYTDSAERSIVNEENRNKRLFILHDKKQCDSLNEVVSADITEFVYQTEVARKTAVSIHDKTIGNTRMVYITGSQVNTASPTTKRIRSIMYILPPQ